MALYRFTVMALLTSVAEAAMARDFGRCRDFGDVVRCDGDFFVEADGDFFFSPFFFDDDDFFFGCEGLVRLID